MRLSSFFTALLLLSGCTEAKPVFDTPSVIIERPVASEASSQKAVASSHPSLLINVPFAPQAPYANWDALHEEACEEMALLMVHHYLEGTALSLEDAEKEVQDLIAWERANGYLDDISVLELAKVAATKYGAKTRLLTDVTAASLRAELAQGNPVIIPAAGRLLGNPYFSGEGPWYHMLVITGYDAKGFITNDPGTKRGEKYWYKEDVLLNAIHDWTGVKEEIEAGAKRALVVEAQEE